MRDQYGRRRRIARLLPLLVILILIIAACSGGTAENVEEPGDAAGTGAAAPPAGEEAAEGDIKVIPFLTAEASPDAVTQITTLIAEFEAANPGVVIELQLMSNDARAARITNAVAVGEELGIFEIERELVPDFTNAGYLLPLTDMVDSIGEENFADGSLLYWPQDGELYQFPADLSAAVQYWRHDLFEAAGLGEPDSYEAILESAETLDGQNGVSGTAQEISPSRGAQGFSTFLWQNCGDWFTDQGELALNSEEARQAAMDYVELTQYAPEGSHTWESFDPITAMASGRAASIVYPGRMGHEIGTNAPDMAQNISVRPATVSRGGQGPQTVYGAVTTYAIGSTVRHPEEARAFLEYILTGDALVQYSLGVPGHIIPALKDEQAQALEADHPYVNEHRDWMEAHFAATEWFNHESQNMGSMNGCEFERSLAPMPWSARVFGAQPPISTFLQQVLLEGADAETTWDQTVEEVGAQAEAWRTDNTWWEPAQ
jgi:multiple sugar transport system substrate-binding protein